MAKFFTTCYHDKWRHQHFYLDAENEAEAKAKASKLYGEALGASVRTFDTPLPKPTKTEAFKIIEMHIVKEKK